MTSERSLRGRLTLLLIAGVGALLLLAAITVRWMIGRWLESEFDGALLTKARVLVTLTKQDALEVELDFADEYMPEFQRQLNPEYFQLWLDDDSVLERSDSLAGKDLARGGALSSAPGYRSIELPDGRSGRQVQVDFVPQVEDDGGSDVDVPLNPRLLTSASGYRWASVVVARSREQLDGRLLLLNLILAGFSILSLAAIALLVRLALRLGLRPLEKVTQQVAQLDVESLSERITLEIPLQELQPVVTQLNALLQRLGAAFDRERRLSSNLAHELRTPIAELLSLADVGRQWPEDTGAVRQFFEDAREIGQQMEKTVAHLLALARFEGGIEGVAIERFDLGELILESWRRLEKKATSRGVKLHCAPTPGLVVEIDRSKMEVMVSNLFSNAITYSPEGSTVACELREDERSVQLTFSNPTTDISPEDLPLMFDRFWRKDSARSGGKHVGLGLTLVKAFSDLLGVSVTAELTEGSQLRLSLTIPRPS